MITKIYGVYAYGGEYEDAWDTLVKAFRDIKKAEAYKETLEYEEQQARNISEMCQKCSGNKDCPHYEQPTYTDSICETHDKYAWRDNEYYRIEEIILEE